MHWIAHHQASLYKHGQKYLYLLVTSSRIYILNLEFGMFKFLGTRLMEKHTCILLDGVGGGVSGTTKWTTDNSCHYLGINYHWKVS